MMHSLFKNPVLISILKIIACVLLIGISHNVFLQHSILLSGYAFGYLLWLYFGVPLCLIMILTGGKPDRTGISFDGFLGKSVISLAGIFIFFPVNILITESHNQITEQFLLWTWNSLYYILLLLIWQPQVLGKRLVKWLKSLTVISLILFTLYLLSIILVVMYAFIKGH